MQLLFDQWQRVGGKSFGIEAAICIFLYIGRAGDIVFAFGMKATNPALRQRV
jgi:hypothetical protein